MAENKNSLTPEATKAALVLERHIDASGYPYQHFYVGLTDDCIRALHRHQARADVEVVRVSSIHVARQVKEYLTHKHNILSADHGGKSDSIDVYAFRLTSTTNPTLVDGLASFRARAPAWLLATIRRAAQKFLKPIK